MKWIKGNIKWLSILVAMTLSIFAFMFDYLPKPALASDLKQLQETVQIMAGIQIQSAIDLREAEIRGIKREYGQLLPTEAQLTIDKLQAEIEALKARL